VAALLALGGADAFARGGGHSGGRHASSSGGHGHHSASTTPSHERAVAPGAVSGTAHSTTGTSGHATGNHQAAAGVPRDSHGRIARSAKAKDDFKRTHPCPSTGRTSDACPGYVIDHVQALKHGGADAPSNMQWQTRAEAKAKDRVE